MLDRLNNDTWKCWTLVKRLSTFMFVNRFNCSENRIDLNGNENLRFSGRNWIRKEDLEGFVFLCKAEEIRKIRYAWKGVCPWTRPFQEVCTYESSCMRSNREPPRTLIPITAELMVHRLTVISSRISCKQGNNYQVTTSKRFVD